MTTVKVVDASALAAILFNESGGEEVGGRLGGAPLLAPSLILFELANVFVRKVRNGILAAPAGNAFALLRQLDLTLTDATWNRLTAWLKELQLLRQAVPAWAG